MLGLACLCIIMILARATRVQSSRWLVDQERLLNGENLLYAVFGEGPLVAAKGLTTLLADLRMSDTATVLCIDVHTTSSVESLRQIQKAINYKPPKSSRPHPSASGVSDLLLVLQNVEKLQGRTELLNLDFLFRLPDKTFESGSVVTALVWDTAKMQQNKRPCRERRGDIDINTDTNTDSACSSEPEGRQGGEGSGLSRKHGSLDDCSFPPASWEAISPTLLTPDATIFCSFCSFGSFPLRGTERSSSTAQILEVIVLKFKF
jgi:hypothetical protein